jgi:hypothetical protein
MTLLLDITQATWWEREIKRRSKIALDYTIYPLLVIILFFLLLAAYVLTFIPDGGMIASITISKEFAHGFLFLTNFVNGGLGVGVLFSILKARQPTFTRYQVTAGEIIDELRLKGRIDKRVQEKMREVVGMRMSPCTDFSRKKECLEGLKRASVELSKMAENIV